MDHNAVWIKAHTRVKERGTKCHTRARKLLWLMKKTEELAKGGTHRERAQFVEVLAEDAADTREKLMRPQGMLQKFIVKSRIWWTWR